jgi:hypothetical protein
LATWGCKSDFPKSYRTTSMHARLFYRSLYAFRHRLHRVDTILPLQLSQPRRISCFETLDDPPHKWESWNHQCTARPKNGAHPGKAIYIQLIGSCAVTNRYTSEAQSPAPGTSHFGIGWIFWRDGRDLGVGYWVFLFMLVVFQFFSFSIFVFTCSRLSVSFLAL